MTTSPRPAAAATPVVLITGGAQRIGRAIAQALHARGCSVCIHFRRSGSLAHQLVAELNSVRDDSAIALAADLLEDDNLPDLVRNVIDRLGRLDGLVNNASSFYPTALGTIRPEDFADLFGTNLRAPLFLSQACAQELRRTSGAILNIVDIHAERPLYGYSVYSAAKAGLLGLTRSLAVELGPEVRVNGIAPGAIQWPADGQFSLAEREKIIEQTLLKRVGDPRDIATAACFLLLDATYTTGQVLAVDGGRNLYL